VVIFHDGKEVKGKTLGYNKNIDSGMVKIVDEGKWPFVEMGKSADLKKGQWVICTGHPGGFKTGRPPVVRLGRVLDVDADEIRTDCTLVGGDSGGPLFDLEGKVVGIHSRIGEAPKGSPSADALKQNIHVPIDTYTETFTRLADGESWGSLRFTSRATRPWLGLTVDVDNKKECKVLAVVDKGPSSKAGIKPGDTILKFDGRPLGDSDDLDIVLKRKKPDEVVELEIKRGDETLMMKLTIGKKS
jgi:serine protease Do